MNEKGDVTDSILGWIQDHDIAELAHDTERSQVAQQLAALRAEVAAVRDAVRAFGADCAEYVAQTGEIPSGPFHRLAALGASAPDAGLSQWVTGGGTLDVMPWGWRCGVCGSSGTGWHRGHRCRPFAPLPEPVAQLAGPSSPLSPEVEAALAVIRKASDAGLFDAKPETARALAAWARTQQQPALGNDVREAMREAAEMLEGTGTDDYDACCVMAARLRELAGERGRGFATIPGWQAGEP